MNRTVFIRGALLIALIPVCTDAAKPYEYVPADRGRFPLNTGETVILPESFLREYDPVTAFFASRKNNEAPGPADNGDRYMKLSPHHPGEYVWIDNKTLEFRPTIPWPPVSRFTVKADGVRKELATILTPPSRITPASGSTDLGAVNKITLEFAYPVEPAALKTLVKFESAPLPGLDRSQSILYTSADYTIKAGEQKTSGAVAYTFIFENPFALGHKVRTIVTLSDIQEFSEGKRTYFFETKADFRLTRIGTHHNLLSVGPEGGAYSVDNALTADEQGRIVLEFSSRPEKISLSQAKSLIMFSPSPRSFNYTQSGNRITATAKLEPERLYKVTIQPIPIKDQSNRALIMNGPASFYCFRNPEKRYIRWAESFNLLERFGPQHMPLQIANIGSFDLRIHKIDPLNKFFWPFPESPVSINESALPPGPGEEPPLERTIVDPLSSGTIKKHIRMLGSPHFSTVIDARAEGVLRHQTLDLKPKFAAISGAEQPGTYLVGFRELNGKSSRYYVKVQVTDLCVSTVESKNEALFAVTSYRTGKPVGGAHVYIEGIRNNTFTRLFEAKTNSDGMCIAPGGLLYDAKTGARLRRVVIHKDDDYLALDVRRNNAPPSFADNHWSRGGDWLTFLRSKPYAFEKDRVWKGFVFPERPVYRPEEKVYLKGYVRSIFQGAHYLPQRDSATLEIVGPDNTWRFPLVMTEHGSFNHVFAEENPATGEYRVKLSYDPPAKNAPPRTLANAGFRIDAYRIPRFEVHLHGPDQAPNDQPFTINLTASYYAGGVVIDCPVRWRVQAYPYSWTPRGWDGYFLSSDSRYSRSMRVFERHTIDEEGRTDDQGAARLTIQSDDALGGNPAKYVVEATVTDVDEQTVTNVCNVVALPPFVLAITTDRYVPRGSTIKASLAAIGVDDNAVAGQKVSVTLKKKTWHHYLQETDFARSEPQYITEENVSIIEKREVITKSEPLTVTFDDQAPGVYVIELNSRDKLGRLQTLQLDLFLAGDRAVSWKKSEQNVFETVTDKDAYEPGDRANIILKSPYQQALALAVVERPDGVPAYEWVRVSGGQATFSLAVTEDMVDRIPVSFLLMRPRVKAAMRMPEGHFVDVGKPKTEANTTWLTVKPTANRATVALEHRKVHAPGDTMHMAISLADWKGEPIKGEVTLWLVDQAVLSLGEEMRLDPVPSFIQPVSSHIRMRDSRNMARGMVSDRESPGGGEGEGEPGEGPVQITVRKNFKTVPYYNSGVRVDKTGKVTITIPLPDNLTRFAIRAVAVSGPQRFGFAKSQVSIRLPVIVQPSLPRFVRVGDRFKAGGVARIVEGDGGEGRYSIETEGVKVISGPAGDRWRAFSFPGKKAQPLFVEMMAANPGYNREGWPVRDSVTVQMAVRKAADRGGDAFRVSIPLLPDRDPVTRQSLRLATPDSSAAFEGIHTKVRENTLVRQLVIYDELPLLKALAGLRYLIEYPHGCVEQKVSRAYPSLAYQDIWRRAGIENPDPQLEQNVNETVAWLEKCQDDNGLMGYWPGDDGTVHLTAYAVEFLATVKKCNTENTYAFPETMFQRACDALERSLRSDYSRFLSRYTYFERCAAAHALAKAGKTDRSYLKQLAYHSQETDALSQARIYAAIVESKMKMNKALADLEGKLWDHTVFTLRNGQEVFSGLQQGSSRLGAEVHGSEIGTLAGLVGALSRASGDPRKVAMMAEELATLGRADGWGNTHNNSLALLAFGERLRAKAESDKVAMLTVECGGAQEELTCRISAGALSHDVTAKERCVVSVDAAQGGDSLYVRFFERFLPSALGSEVAASQEGFVVKRRIMYISEENEPVKKEWIDSAGGTHQAPLGAIIEEHLQITNPADRHFVAVIAPLAAGVEYLNPNLKTASAEFAPRGKTDNPGTYQALYDDRVAYYFKYMKKGTYNFYFRVRATTEGSFTQPPAYVEMMYDEAVRGNSPGTKIVVSARRK